MPKQRTPLDYPRYQELRNRGLSQDQIAKELGIPESTLRDNLKHHLQAQALRGRPEGDLQPPQGPPVVHPHPHQQDPAPGPPEIHPGLHEQIPSPGPPEVHRSLPMATFTARDLEDLQALLAWWRGRQQQLEGPDDPQRHLERQTYHVERRFIEAVRREADLTGESYAAIVNRAFAQYFAGRSGIPRTT